MLPSVLPTESDHVPVLAGEVVYLLDPRPGETVVDGTFGAGGHATLLAGKLRGDGKLIAIDRDPTVAPFFDRFRRETGVKARLHHGEFSTVLQHLAENGVRADVILLDLGVSSMQLDRPERGFSYAADAPLDMRMDPGAEYSARELVNEGGERELADIFKRYGEERYARQIARAIVRRRASEPFERTGDLVEVVKAAIPAPARFGEGHPAKRVFQALRIEVNDELGAVERALPAALEMLRPGRSPRRDLVPLAGGPDRQAVPPQAGAGLHVPTRLPDLCLRLRAGDARDAAPRGAPWCRRNRPEPARAVRAPEGGDEGWLASRTPSPPSPSPSGGRAPRRAAEDAPRRGPRAQRNPLDRRERDSARGRRIRERGRAPAQPLARLQRPPSARSSAPRTPRCSRSSRASSRRRRSRRAPRKSSASSTPTPGSTGT